MIQRASLRSAPAVLNMGDKAVWVTGWNEAVDALEAEQAQTVEPPTMSFESLIGTTQHRPALPAQQAQIEDLRTQLARRTVERDMAIQMSACGEQALAVEPCGGCGQKDSDKRCIGCLHPFAKTGQPAEPTVKQPLSTERAGLIRRAETSVAALNSRIMEPFFCALDQNAARTLSDCINMLEADVSLINEGNKAQQVAVPPGYALAMAVLQSSLYQWLDDVERAECDALIAAGQRLQGDKP